MARKPRRVIVPPLITVALGTEVHGPSDAFRSLQHAVDGVPFQNQPFSFLDGGGNTCGCPFPPAAVCVAQSAALAPSPPAQPIE